MRLLSQATDPLLPPGIRTQALLWRLVLEARQARVQPPAPLTDEELLSGVEADVDGVPFPPEAL